MATRSRNFLGRPLPPDRLFVIAGPCVIESEAMSFDVAGKLKETCEDLQIDLIFKSSYMKANRSSVDSYVGPAVSEGLRILEKVRTQLGIPVLTDVHTPEEVARTAEAVDVLQIPAFLSRQTALLQEAARHCRFVNVKKGQFLAARDMARVVEKIHAVRDDCEIWLTERGTTFGYGDLIVDMRGFEIMCELPGTVVFDVTHSLQHPGIGGDRRFAGTLARAALAAGADGLFLETHPDPERALSDSATQLPLETVPAFLEEMRGWKEFAAARSGRRAQ